MASRLNTSSGSSLSNLRDYGPIEQDADIILLVSRPTLAKPELGPELQC